MKQVLLDQRSSTDVLYWEAFKEINFDIAELLLFKGTLVGFSGEHVQVLGHFPVIITFGSGYNAKSVNVRYLIINVVSPYNIIIDKPSFNALEAMLSTLYFTLKYPLKDGRVGVVKGEKGVSKKML